MPAVGSLAWSQNGRKGELTMLDQLRLLGRASPSFIRLPHEIWVRLRRSHPDRDIAPPVAPPETITRLRDDGMTCAFALSYAIDSPRFDRVIEEVQGWYVHRLKVTDPSELDDQVQSWLRESYRLMGMQERLGEY